jgi:hypothetical protein
MLILEKLADEEEGQEKGFSRDSEVFCRCLEASITSYFRFLITTKSVKIFFLSIVSSCVSSCMLYIHIFTVLSTKVKRT